MAAKNKKDGEKKKTAVKKTAVKKAKLKKAGKESVVETEFQGQLKLLGDLYLDAEKVSDRLNILKEKTKLLGLYAVRSELPEDGGESAESLKKELEEVKGKLEMVRNQLESLPGVKNGLAMEDLLRKVVSEFIRLSARK